MSEWMCLYLYHVSLLFFSLSLSSYVTLMMKQPEVFDEIDLLNLCLCECSTKNQNHSFQVSKSTLMIAWK